MYRSIRSLISLSRAFELLPPPPFGAKLCLNARPNFFCKRQNQRPWLPRHGPSLKARPCRPFFGHSHAKVNYLPLTPPYLKITLVFRWKDWTLPVLIPHSQPSKVVTGLPEGGEGFSSGLETIDAWQTWKLSEVFFLNTEWKAVKTLENMKSIFINSKRPKIFLFTKYFWEDCKKRNGCTGMITSEVNFVCVLFSSDGIL